MTKQSKTGAVTQAIINYLSMVGWFVWRNNTGGVWDPDKKIFRKNKNIKAGVPDIQGIDWLGRSISIEVKGSGDRCSADQTLFAVEAIARGAFYCIATNVDDVISTMKFYGYHINDNGYVISTTHKTLVDSIFDRDLEDSFIPNANKLKNLKQIEKATISTIAVDKMRSQTVKLLLGKYAGRVL
jgi:hypothetical protein